MISQCIRICGGSQGKHKENSASHTLAQKLQRRHTAARSLPKGSENFSLGTELFVLKNTFKPAPKKGLSLWNGILYDINYC